MHMVIKITAGPDAGKSISLSDGDCLTFGRGDKVTNPIHDPSVSRLHCEISRNGSTVIVRDLGSSSGTKHNGEPIDMAELYNGCEIQLGDTTMVLDDGDSGLTTMNNGSYGAMDGTGFKPIDDLVGERIRHYALESILGKGKTGVVYKAFDTEKNRYAALKILAPQQVRLPQQRERFVRAMKTMIPIRCPNIVRIYNAGITGPFCWSAMEYIEGENLAQLIDRLGIDHMLDWRKVWKVALDISKALMTAHENKIVHRNVTPTNIIQRASDGVCLLGDLMLAKAIDGEHAVNITQPGQLIGEITYLAPERTAADGAVDIRSDIYGLGATCYALLTGRPPVEGDNLAELLNNIRYAVPKPPREYQLAINEHFQDLVLHRMLAKNPNDRMQTPAELIKELLKIGKYNQLSID